jgi:Cu+-exporting ATPase
VLLAEHAVTPPPEAHDLYLFENGKLVAGIVLEDELKPGAAKSIAELHTLGIRTAILSGDRRDKCDAIAKALGIDEVYAEKRPAEKLEVLRALQAKEPVAFVGDGVNDAPSLAQAGVGISLSNASAAAIHSSQVILLNGELPYLVYAVRIARRTFTVIKQNLFWAFSYNIVAIPLAAFGFLTPTVAALSMAFSDVLVVANSLRLRFQRVAG